MLDACNGRTAPTPEYPSGTYAYYTTVDSSFTSFYPYVIGPCYYGVATTPNGKGVSVPSSVTTYYKYSSGISIAAKEKLFYIFSVIGPFLIIKNFGIKFSYQVTKYINKFLESIRVHSQRKNISFLK